jgi:hypothetical protein
MLAPQSRGRSTWSGVIFVDVRLVWSTTTIVVNWGSYHKHMSSIIGRIIITSSFIGHIIIISLQMSSIIGHTIRNHSISSSLVVTIIHFVINSVVINHLIPRVDY